MSKGNEPTTKFKVDITELKAGIQEANRQIRLANSEFKAAASGMDDWGKSADGISAKLKQLESVLGAEENKLELLKQQHQLVAEEQGENSKAAQELMIKINNQQAAINKVTSEIGKYTNQLDEIESASADAGTASANLGDSFEDTRTASQRLADEIADQKGQLDTLKSQYADVALEQGKDSEAAKELESKISSLNSELQANETKLSEATYAVSDLGDAVDDAADSAEKAEGGFTVLKGALASLAAEGIKKVASELGEMLGGLDKTYNQFQAQTGKTTAEMSEFKEQMDEVYRAGYGEGLDDIGQAMATVAQNSKETDPDKIKELTENALTLRDTFDFDVNESMRAANMLVDQFGVTGEQAFNLIAQGAQNGLNKNGDLLDSINEYSVHYEQLGYTAEEFFNSLANGTEAGTFSVDKLGDTMKEFGIRTKDTAESTTEGFNLLGYDADMMREKFTAGGESARVATQAVLSALLNMDDKVKQNQAGVDLFGSMWEDLGIQGVAALMDVTGAADMTEETMREIDELQFSNVSAQAKQIGRIIKTDFLQPVAETLLPVVKDGLTWTKENLNTLLPIIVGVGTAIATYFVVGKITAFVGAIQAMVAAFMGAPGVIAGVKAAMAALNITMTANPIGLIVAAIAGLVAGLVTAYNKVDWFRDGVNAAWSAIKSGVSDALGWVVNFFKTTLPNALRAVPDFIKENWSSILLMLVNPFAGAFKLIYDNSEEFRNFINNLFNKIISAIQNFFPNIVDSFSNFVSTVKSLFEQGKFVELGVYLVKGIASGIISGITLPVRAVTTLASKIVTAFKNKLKIHSPSKVMEEQGEYAGEGVAQGLENSKEDVKKATEKLAEQVEKNLDVNQSKFEKMLDGLTEAIKRSLEEQRDARLDSIEKELDAEEKASERRLEIYEKEYNDKIKYLDEQTNEQTKAIQAQIDAIDEQLEAEEKAKEEKEYIDKLKSLNEKLLAAETEEDKEEIRKEIAEEKEDWEEKKRKEELAAQKEALRAQIEAVKENAEKEKEMEKEYYDSRVECENAVTESFKEARESESQAVSDYYDELLEEDNINAQARALVMSKNQDEILRLLSTYNPKWQDAGQSLADSILYGLNSEKQSMQDAVSESLNLADVIPQQVSYLEDLKSAIEAMEEDDGLGGLKTDLDDVNYAMEDTIDDMVALEDEMLDVEEQSQSTGEKMGGFFSGAIDKVKTFFSEGADKASSFFGTLPEKISTWFSDTTTKTSNWSSEMVTKAKETGSKFVDNVVGFIKSLPDKFYDMTVNVLGHLVAWGIQLYQFATTEIPEFVNKVVGFIKELPDKIKTWLTNAYNNTVNWGKNMVSIGKEKAKEFLERISSVKELPEKVKKWFDETVEKAKEFGKNLVSKGKQAGADLVEKLTKSVSELPDKLYEIGTNALQGFWDGLKSVGSGIKNWAEKFFDDILAKAEEVLEIGSPSKAFRRIGAWTMEGFDDGMLGESKKTLKHTKSIFSKMIEKSKAGLSNAKNNINDWVNTFNPIRDINAVKGTNVTNNYNFVQNNTSPKSLSRLEIYRQTKNQLSFVKGV